ncbi:hypothetical protein FKG94_14240 [Exilibacterium tricleocarpae]|uniref:Uncharacterized protein n=1 Tax=Exilibacterium tricleocarpae TaxID=2591008 RepID=A0A545TM04_9GAMM|nr:hypothetical protein [Exilibacterium tricleocarpae]TQV78224.1 hypothetical protein FKG94_14240 [Exilibacterium tricleocarpae]
MSETIISNFEYERMLKILLPSLKENQIAVLQSWKAKQRAYYASWESFSLCKIKATALKVKEHSAVLAGFEDTIRGSISSIFLEIPDPETITGRWDAGREKAETVEREKAIIAINKIVCQSYEDLWKNLDQVHEFLESVGECDCSIVATEENHAVESQTTSSPEIKTTDKAIDTRSETLLKTSPEWQSEKSHNIEPKKSVKPGDKLQPVDTAGTGSVNQTPSTYRTNDATPGDQKQRPSNTAFLWTDDDI